MTTGLIGVTRVFTPQDIVQLNFGYSKGSGYYSDPYKLNDNRPRERNALTALARWNHHFDDNGTDGTVHLSYRYYSDTFGIRANTLDAEYVQPLYCFASAGNGESVPLLKIMERTHEEATKALHAGRESRHPEAASVGAGSHLRLM